MDDTKREELERMCKKIHKVRTRMVAVRMVRVRNMSVEETADIPIRRRTCLLAWTGKTKPRPRRLHARYRPKEKSWLTSRQGRSIVLNEGGATFRIPH